MMKETDKRLEFPFGCNIMTPLERLRYEGLNVRFNQETGKLMVGPKHLLARWSDFIVEHRDSIIADLDEQKKADALAKLPPVEFDQGEAVVMREAVLLKLPDGSYLAATPEEVRKLDMRAGSARAKRAAGESSAKQPQQQSAGLFSSRPKRKTSSTISPSS
jgi:hypothetical protein